MRAYREKKSLQHPVLLIFTKNTAENVTVTKKRGTQEIEKIKPAMIDSYNKFMGGVDGSNKMLYTYLDERRTLKFWKKIVFNIFGRMVLDSYIIYKENSTDQKMSRFQFTLSIIETIEKEWLAVKD